MRVKRIGSRGILFTFSDLVGTKYDCTTNLYVIHGREYLFICDTFLGPEAVQPVKEYIQTHFPGKAVILFNSHADWDHVWGNCAFDADLIIAHRACQTRMKNEGSADLAKYAQFQRGPVRLVLPNLTFEERLSFPEEGVEFFHSPGHTADSATCYDRVDRVLFAGDNVEDPIPYLTPGFLDDHRASLRRYLDIQAGLVIPGHGEAATRELIRRNLEYTGRFQAGEEESCPTTKYAFIHQCNLEANKRSQIVHAE